MVTKNEYIKKLWFDKAVIVQKDPFTLKSNRQSCVYINHRNFICLPENFNIIISLISSLINKHINGHYALCNVTSTISPILIGALCNSMKIPFYFYRPISSEKGIIADIFSYDFNPSSTFQKKLPAILVDDVVTTTNTFMITAQSLEFGEIKTIACLSLVDRRISSEKREMPFLLKSVITLEEILIFGLKELSLGEEDKNIIEIELNILKS